MYAIEVKNLYKNYFPKVNNLEIKKNFVFVLENVKFIFIFAPRNN